MKEKGLTLEEWINGELKGASAVLRWRNRGAEDNGGDVVKLTGVTTVHGHSSDQVFGAF